MKQHHKRITFHVRAWLPGFFLLAGLAACTGHFFPNTPAREEIFGTGFVIVTAQAGDTNSSLAHTYLGDSRMAWIIAEYNGLDSPTAGDKVVIPQKPPAPGGIGPNGYQTVPVLYYPHISVDPQDRRVLSAAAFMEQMQWLKDNGYVTVTLDQLQGFMQMQDSLPSKSVIISFDTAQRWLYETVAPILQQLGYTAALFLPTQSIGAPDAMTWAELASLSAAGFDIGACGRSSQSLIVKPQGRKFEEWFNDIDAGIAEAAEIIHTQLGIPCRYFAYPDGETNDLLVTLLKKHGYVHAFTRRPGPNPFFADNFRLGRTTIDGETGWMQFTEGTTIFQAADLR